jgi:hypothetical protein
VCDVKEGNESNDLDLAAARFDHLRGFENSGNEMHFFFVAESHLIDTPKYKI